MATVSPLARTTGARAAPRAALDVLLTDAAVAPGGVRGFLQPSSTAKAAAGVIKRPDRAARRAGALAGELASIAAGR